MPVRMERMAARGYMAGGRIVDTLAGSRRRDPGFGQQLLCGFHREADDVRQAPLDSSDERVVILNAVSASLAFPEAAGDVALELLLGHRSHDDRRMDRR